MTEDISHSFIIVPGLMRSYLADAGKNRSSTEKSGYLKYFSIIVPRVLTPSERSFAAIAIRAKVAKRDMNCSPWSLEKPFLLLTS